MGYTDDMHEFGICRELVSAVVTEMNRLDPPARCMRRVRVVVGALRQVIPDNLTFAYEVLTRGTPAEGSTLEIAAVPVTARCEQCGQVVTVEDAVFLCIACGSSRLELLSGMELYLDTLEIERDDIAKHQSLS